MKGHVFGAGDPGAARLRKERREAARLRNANRAKQATAPKSDTGDRGKPAGR